VFVEERPPRWARRPTGPPAGDDGSVGGRVVAA